MAGRTKPKGATTKSNSRTAGISDEAVAKATGRNWAEWGKILDKDGCKKLPHKEIAALVHDKHGVGSWWSQMVTVGYEQSRGLREAHECCDGWKSSVSRTVDVPLSRLYEAWSNRRARNEWLNEPIVVRKETLNKSMRITWPDQTSVEVNFYAKGAGKSQVAVQHSKLKGKTQVERSKKYWAHAMDRLKARLGLGA